MWPHLAACKWSGLWFACVSDLNHEEIEEDALPNLSLISSISHRWASPVVAPFLDQWRIFTRTSKPSAFDDDRAWCSSATRWTPVPIYFYRTARLCPQLTRVTPLRPFHFPSTKPSLLSCCFLCGAQRPFSASMFAREHERDFICRDNLLAHQICSTLLLTQLVHVRGIQFPGD